MSIEGGHCAADDAWEEEKKIYILPTSDVVEDAPDEFEKEFKALRMLILADGNNRAKGLNEGYDDGGKNVVNVAEYLARRGDIAALIACIVSKYNAVERSDEFFWRLYQAFATLGIRIETKETLLKDNIKQSVHGDMKSLKEKGGARAQFAAMVETVIKKTDEIEEPNLELILGVNYGDDIAKKQRVKVIIRSGMEIPNAVRLSGIRTHKGIKIFGTTTLWPYFTNEEIERIIEAARTEKPRVMREGYSPKEILDIALSPLKPGTAKVAVYIPFTGSLEDAGKEFFDYFAKKSDSDISYSIHLHKEEGHTVSHYGNQESSYTLHVIPADAVERGQFSLSYDSMIAPGQKGMSFILPERPEPRQATIISCDKTPEAIAETIQAAIIFCTNSERLNGKERKASGEFRFGQYIKEYADYERMAIQYGLGTMDDLKNCVKEFQRENPRSPEAYLKIKEIFIAYMLQWAKKTGFTINNEPQFRAFVNYAATSLFMTYFPQYAGWEKQSDGAIERSFGEARYMINVNMTDEHVYDYEIEDPVQKKQVLRLATRLLCEAANGKTIQPSRIPKNTPNRDVLLVLCNEYRDMRHEFDSNQNQEMVNEWTAGIQSLFRGFAAEWSKDLTDTSRLGPTVDIAGLAGKASPLIKQKIKTAEKKFTSKNVDKQLDGGTDLLLYRYLLGIEDSIGAGLAFRTIACLADPQDIPPEAMKNYQELCFLMNLFYRIANDISGNLSRRYNDQENKTDCCAIVGSKYFKKGLSPEEALIKSVVDLKKFMDELKESIEEKRALLVEQWPLLGIAFVHADIAELIYGKGHYRTITSGQMDGFIKDLYYSANPPSV